jgi:3D (Asp-Asp-Asp) domain-containing protein
LRVWTLVLVLALAFAVPRTHADTKYQHNQISAFELAAQKKQVLEGFAQPTGPTIPPVVTLTPTPALSQQMLRAASAPPVVEEQPQQSPQPTREAEPGTLEVWITFYYCQRTIDKPDDGGGYCGGTKTGTTVHTGTAACQSSWLGRPFKIVGDNPNQVYTCEDTGSSVAGNQVDIWFYTNGEGWHWPLRGRGTIIWLN